MHILHFQISEYKVRKPASNYSDHLKIRTLVPQGKSHVCEKPVLCLHFPSSVISMLSDWLHRGQKLRHTRAKPRNVSVGKLRSLFSLCPTVICATTCLVVPPTQKSIRLERTAEAWAWSRAAILREKNRNWGILQLPIFLLFHALSTFYHTRPQSL